MMKRIIAIARVCHEANRAYCQALGDYSQPPWEEAPQWQKDSAIAGVHYTIKKPMATPSMSHANWWAQKMRDGWSYGSVKDPEKKTHPCMKPYNELPLEQRAKDHIFQGIVRTMWNN